MKAYSWRVYFVAAVVAVVSIRVTSQFSQNEWVEILMATPIPVALLTILYQIFRDNAAFERELIKQNENNDFVLSATSHMANKAFDKHVEFAEEYLPLAENGVIKLFQAMPAEENMQKVARALADDLFGVRKKFSLWVTEEIRVEVEPFEKALRKMDGLAGLIASRDPSENRGTLVQTLFATLKKVGDAKENEKDAAAEEGALRLKEKLQALLGIPQLTILRQIYVAK